MVQGLGMSQHRALGHRGTELGVIMLQGSGTSWHRALGHHGTGLGDIVAQERLR